MTKEEQKAALHVLKDEYMAKFNELLLEMDKKASAVGRPLLALSFTAETTLDREGDVCFNTYLHFRAPSLDKSPLIPKKDLS